MVIALFLWVALMAYMIHAKGITFALFWGFIILFLMLAQFTTRRTK